MVSKGVEVTLEAVIIINNNNTNNDNDDTHPNGLTVNTDTGGCHKNKNNNNTNNNNNDKHNNDLIINTDKNDSMNNNAYVWNKLELKKLRSMRASNRVIPPSDA